MKKGKQLEVENGNNKFASSLTNEDAFNKIIDIIRGFEATLLPA